jgi:hypothetical protein
MRAVRSALLGFAALLAAPAARADVVITVAPSIGPNIFGSPSYDAYAQNALQALQSGGSTAGTPGTPSFYQALPSGSTISPSDIVVTDFPSWRGTADPTGAYANELGSRLYFGLSVLPVPGTPSTQFSISQLSFTATGDPTGTLNLDFPGGYEYSSDYVGLIFNADGTITQVTSGPSTQLVDALVGRGTTNGYSIVSTDPGATDQDKINNFVPAGGFTYTGTYSLGNQSASASVDIAPAAVPTPPSVLLLGFGFVALAGRRLRTR